MYDIKLIKETLDIDLPQDLTISTITVTAKLYNLDNKPIQPNIRNIALYARIDTGTSGIKEVKCGKIYRKTVNDNDKVQKKDFFNQVSLSLYVKSKIIHVKFFKNGSIQMAGFRSFEDCLEVIKYIDDLLKRKVFEVVKNNFQYKIIRRRYISCDEFIIKDIKIAMINTNFKYKHRIFRNRLRTCILKTINETKEGTYPRIYWCNYDPNINSPHLNLRYAINKDTIISLFIFESGSIIITGGKNLKDFVTTYNWINSYLDEHAYITTSKTNEFIKDPEMIQFLKKINVHYKNLLQ